MCFQGFINCSCGHVELKEAACNLATDIPFYLKVACQNYNFQSIKTSRACGRGRFYCRETHEGQFFEDVYQYLDDIQVELEQINASGARLDALAAKFHQTADKENVSKEALQRHPAYSGIFDSLEALCRGRDQITAKRMVLVSVIQEGLNYYQRQAEKARPRSTFPVPPFSLPYNLRSQLPPRLQIKLAALAAPDIIVSAAMTPEAIYIDDNKQSSFRQANTESENIHATSDSQGYCNRNILGTPFMNERQEGGAIPQTGDLNELPSIPKKRGRSKQEIQQERSKQCLDIADRKFSVTKTPGLLGESPGVRRSERVRNKNVSYAESEASTILSREASPEKSDKDDFSPPKSDRDDISPPKSDVSTSPERRVVRRRQKTSDLRKEVSGLHSTRSGGNNNSLGDLMDDWKRMHNSGSFTNQQHVPTAVSTDDSFSGHVSASISNPNNLFTGNMAASIHQMLGASRVTTSVTGPGAGASQDWILPTQDGSSAVHALKDRSDGSMVGQSPADTMSYWPGVGASGSSISHMSPVTRTNMMNASYQRGHFHTPVRQSNVNRHWMINTPAFNELSGIQRQGGSQIQASVPMARNDSVTGIIARGGHAVPASASLEDSNSGKLRRNLGTAAYATPPAHIDLTSTDTDPKKRSLPASSPLPTSNKRTRLSIPGEDSTSVSDYYSAHTVAGSMSSPLELQSEQLNGGRKDNVVPTTAMPDLPAMRAPVLAPTPIMLVPPIQNSDNEGSASLDPVDIAEHAGGTEGTENEKDNQSSDIDWSLINDDFL